MAPILIFLIKYAFLQGLLLSLWLWIRQRQFLFAAFFLVLSYLLLIYLLEVEGWYLQLPHLLWTNVPFWFLLAPLLFLQALNTLSASRENWHGKNLLHFFPAVGALVYMLPYYAMSTPEKVSMFETFYSQEYIVDYVQMAYLLQLSLYAVFGKRFLKRNIRQLKDQFSRSDIINLSLLSTSYILLGTYILFAAILSVLLSFSADTGLVFYSLAFLLLSCTIIVATLIFLNAGAEGQFNQDQYSLVLDDQEYQLSPKYVNSPLSKHDLKGIVACLELNVKGQQLYKNPELKLADLARQTQIPSHHISQALNQVLGKTFFSYINAQRVEAVKKQLDQGKYRSLTLIAIAEECGFRSESSFYRIFKSHTGLTPKAYIQQHS